VSSAFTFISPVYGLISNLSAATYSVVPSDLKALYVNSGAVVPQLVVALN
jgi:hypothetical protein